MTAPTITYICINLPTAEERRRAILAQAEQHGIEIKLLPAIAGKDLPEELPQYDRKRRRKMFPEELTANERACMLSHIKALEMFVESGAEYGVIMEDDAVLAENFNEGIREIIEHLHGWEVAKLTTDDGKLYSLGAVTEAARQAGAPVVPVFPKKIMWVAVGYLYTRRGAQKLLAGLSRFYLAADVQIGKVLCKQCIPTIGVTPSLIVTSDPDNSKSTISTAECPRGKAEELKRSLFQYVAYRLNVWESTFGKRRMRRMMSRLLTRS